MRISTALAAAASAVLATANMGDAAPANAHLNSRQTGTRLLCVANIVAQLNFTVPSTGDIVANITLVGGGGGASSNTGRGGGGGSTSIDIHGPTFTRYYAPGGHGGYIHNQDESYSGHPGSIIERDNIRLPANANVTVTVGGGGGAASTSCDYSSGYKGTTWQMCWYGNGAGGSGAYGGGGGGNNDNDHSGGAGGEANGQYTVGNGGGHADPGKQWLGGNGQDADTKSYYGDGAFGASWGIGNFNPSKGGNGGGFGGGGGSCSIPMGTLDPNVGHSNGGWGGSYGQNGGPSRSVDDAGQTYSYYEGPDYSGKGACYMTPSGKRNPPSQAGLGGSGSKEEGQGTYGGNGGYAIIVYYSPDGVNCPIETQTLPTPTPGNGSWCDASKLPYYNLPVIYPKTTTTKANPGPTAASSPNPNPAAATEVVTSPSTTSAPAPIAVKPTSTSVPSSAFTTSSSNGLASTFIAMILSLMVVVFTGL